MVGYSTVPMMSRCECLIVLLLPIIAGQLNIIT